MLASGWDKAPLSYMIYSTLFMPPFAKVVPYHHKVHPFEIEIEIAPLQTLLSKLVLKILFLVFQRIHRLNIHLCFGIGKNYCSHSYFPEIVEKRGKQFWDKIRQADVITGSKKLEEGWNSESWNKIDIFLNTSKSL